MPEGDMDQAELGSPGPSKGPAKGHHVEQGPDVDKAQSSNEV